MTCTLQIPIISQKESLVDLHLRDQVARCGTCRCDWLHRKTVGVLHSRRTTEKDAAVDVTRHRKMLCKKFANHVEQRVVS
ncbi:hypothetical protein V8E51_019177 [Hyaloscypha variabilis]